VYYTLGAGELALIPVILWQTLGPGMGMGIGITLKALGTCLFFLVLPLALRVYVLFVRPELLGRYREGGKVD